MTKLLLVLHAHLPYVRHPEHPVFLEENWFFEGMIETYLPLLMMMDRLTGDHIPWGMTMTLSPPLLSMMEDPLLTERFGARLHLLTELSDREVDRTRGGEYAGVAAFYQHRFHTLNRFWKEELGGQILSGFRRHIQTGQLEAITCCATHGFLPLLSTTPESVKAQIRVGVSTHERILGVKPRGIWLAECGYFTGVDKILSEEGLQFFLMDTHGLLYANPFPQGEVYAPIKTPAGVYAFGRDPESSHLVWSAENGYPGDPLYRDFYRDIGYDLPYDLVSPYLHTDGPRGMTGLKYHRITGKTDQKEVYDPRLAREKAGDHARDFMRRKEEQSKRLSSLANWSPTVVCPFDAELFGHWWFEGVDFIEGLFRGATGSVVLTTPTNLLSGDFWVSDAQPEPSSWGVNGYNDVWINQTNDWIWPYLSEASREMTQAVRLWGKDPAFADVLAQMGRELLLAQSSDWPFLLTTGTAVEYAQYRISEHLFRFKTLRSMLENAKVDWAIVEDYRGKSPLFPDLNPWVFA